MKNQGRSADRYASGSQFNKFSFRWMLWREIRSIQNEAPIRNYRRERVRLDYIRKTLKKLQSGNLAWGHFLGVSIPELKELQVAAWKRMNAAQGRTAEFLNDKHSQQLADESEYEKSERLAMKHKRCDKSQYGTGAR